MSSKSLKFMIVPWLIWGIAVLCYCNQYFLRISVSGLTPDLVRSYHINAISLSIVAASFYYAYLIMQIPCGMLVDRYGPRITLTISTLLCALGSAIFTGFDSVALLTVGRFVMGIGAAFALISTLNLTRIWFDRSQFTLVSAVTLMVGTLGALLGGAPLIILSKAVPMHVITGSSTAITIVLSILAWCCVRDRPASLERKVESQAFFATLSESTGSRTVWYAALLSGFLFAPITVFAGLWCIPFLTDLYGKAVWVKSSSAVIFIGLAAGGISTAKLSLLTHRVVLVIRGCAIVSLIAMCVIAEFRHVPAGLMILLLFVLGFSISAYMLVFTVVGNEISKQASATAFGLTNFFQVCVGSLLLPLMGYLLMWGKTIFQGPADDRYSPMDYHHAMIIMPISLACALVLSFCLKNKPN